MAKLKQFTGVKVCVKSPDFQTLKEYDTDEKDANSESRVTKYIVAESGAPFKVGVQVSKNFLDGQNDLMCRLFIDGEAFQCKVFSKDDIKNYRMGCDFRGQAIQKGGQ